MAFRLIITNSSRLLRSKKMVQPPIIQHFNKPPIATARDYSSDSNNATMADSGRIVNIEEVLKVIDQPNKLIIDVRNPDEILETGNIPSSINIPLPNVQDVLSVSDEEFLKKFQRAKPSSADEIIFYCRSGKRAGQALEKALKLGFTNSKSYAGSWEDWASKIKLVHYHNKLLNKSE